ncbi:DUF6192 family protein [Streptomyces sp. NPDC004752]
MQVPVTAQEKVEAIREMADGDEAVAAQLATDFQRRPEVAFKAMRDAEARDNVNEAQFEQAELLKTTSSGRTTTTPSESARTASGSTSRPASSTAGGSRWSSPI